MEKSNELLRNYWSQHTDETKETFLAYPISFEKLLNSIFGTDLFYYYIVDHCKQSIPYISPSIEEIHGISSKFFQLNDILKNIHPADLNFFFEAEKASLDFILQNIGIDKLFNYRTSFNFRAKNKTGTYSIFNHQTIILNLDAHKGCGLTLNIHTNIDHLNSRNLKTYSLIGTKGDPSYFNLKTADDLSFTKREVE